MKYLLYVLLFPLYSFAQVNETIPINGKPEPDLVWKFNISDFYFPNFFLAHGPITQSGTAIRATNQHIPATGFIKDRYSRPRQALGMGRRTIIDFSTIRDGAFNKFYGLPANTSNEVKKITISMWVKFTHVSDEERILFGAKEENDIDKKLKFGLTLKGKTLILKRYFEHPDGAIGKSWDYECFQPAAFDAGFGWYQIIITFDQLQKYIRLFVGKPNGGAYYGPGTSSAIPGDANVQREFDGRLIWIPGIRKNTHKLNYWFIADAKGLVFDDMMIFNQSFTEAQARALWNDQKPPSLNRKTASNKVVSEIEPPEPILITGLKLYPNPSKDGAFNLEFALKEDGPVSFEIVNLLGQLVFKQQKQHVNKGNQRFQLGGRARGDVNLASGLYTVNVSTNEFSKALKLVVE
jgi:hypothetical protein